MSISSASVGFCPSDRITVPNSLVVMVPAFKQNKVYVLETVEKSNEMGGTYMKSIDAGSYLSVLRTVILPNVEFPVHEQK